MSYSGTSAHTPERSALGASSAARGSWGVTTSPNMWRPIRPGRAGLRSLHRAQTLCSPISRESNLCGPSFKNKNQQQRTDCVTYTYCHRFALEGKHQAPQISSVVKALLLTSSSTIKIYLETIFNKVIVCCLRQGTFKEHLKPFSVISWEFCWIQCTFENATPTDFTWSKTDFFNLRFVIISVDVKIIHFVNILSIWRKWQTWAKFHKIYHNMLSILSCSE